MSGQGEERPTCATCKHWFAEEPVHPNFPNDSRRGNCHAHPPARVAGYGTQGWPDVSSKDFCGEHARIPYSAPVPAVDWRAVDSQGNPRDPRPTAPVMEMPPGY